LIQGSGINTDDQYFESHPKDPLKAYWHRIASHILSQPLPLRITQHQHLFPAIPNCHVSPSTSRRFSVSKMAPIANFTKDYFDEPIHNGLIKSDLISQLQDLDQPTHGLKSKLQARLQLAYLGHAEPELEDQLSSIFSLSKGPLQDKCIALKINNVQGKTMPALRRLVVMALCGIPIPAEGQEMDVDRSPTVQHHPSSPDIIDTFAPSYNPIAADILAVDEAPVSRAQTQQAAQVAGPIAAATRSVQTRQTPSAQQHQAQQHQGMKSEGLIAATTRSLQTLQTPSAQQHQAQQHQGMKCEGPIAAASAVPAPQAPTPQHQTAEPAAAAIETPVPKHKTTTPVQPQPQPPSPVVASIPLPPPRRALPQQKKLSSAESEITTLLDDFLWRTKGLGMGRLNASDRVFLKALVYRFTDKFDERVREARDRETGGIE